MRRLALCSLLGFPVACGQPAPPRPEPQTTEPARTGATSAAPENGERYDALVDEGARLLQVGDLDGARAQFQEASGLAPARIEARYGLGVVSARHCWLSRRECEACVSQLSRVIAEGGYRFADYNRGQCHYVLRDYASALADLDAAITKKPEDADALAARGATLLQLGRTKDACRDLGRAKSLGSPLDSAFNAHCPTLGPAAQCADEKWGGWAGSATCARTAARIIPGAHRACTADKDCVNVATACDPHAVARGSLDAYGRVELPCTDPASGPCKPVSEPRCESGCCVVTR
jgi:tetratricopeptide (TPR) repeat protein